LKDIVVYQPCYYPKLHYMARIQDADVFVVFDDTEFSRQSPQHRAPVEFGESSWLTIPVKHSGDDRQIRETPVDMSQNWRKNHLKTLMAKYGGGAEHEFEEHYHRLEEDAKLSDITVPLLKSLIEKFDIETEVVLSSELNSDYERGEPSEYLLEVVKELNGDRYICGERAYQNYLKEQLFSNEGIDIQIQDWEPKWEDGNVCCLDVLFSSDNPEKIVK
jgi:hypothetical protein